MMHLSVHRDLLIQLIRRDGPQAVLADWRGTAEEAIRELEAGPEFICGCDNRGPDGRCLGHPEPGKIAKTIRNAT